MARLVTPHLYWFIMASLLFVTELASGFRFHPPTTWRKPRSRLLRGPGLKLCERRIQVWGNGRCPVGFVNGSMVIGSMGYNPKEYHINGQ